MPHIRIRNAWQGTLDHISVDLPKNSLTVVTGVSGSGKSTLLVDVLFQECQRKYLEALSMQGIAKPGVERIQGASPAVLIPQTAANRSPRSTVGRVMSVPGRVRSRTPRAAPAITLMAIPPSRSVQWYYYLQFAADCQPALWGDKTPRRRPPCGWGFPPFRSALRGWPR